MRVLAAVLIACVASPGLAQVRAPSLDAIQAAYESAKAEAQERHDDQLKVREAECEAGAQGQVTCQIGFTDERSSDGRLYFDVIGLDPVASGWKLVSGLCRR